MMAPEGAPWDLIWTAVWRGTLGVFVLVCVIYGFGGGL